MTKASSHDAYIAAAPEPLRAPLARLRVQLAQALPDADEVMMYGMPGFRIEGTLVAGYAAFSKQCGLYVDAGAIADNVDAISALNLKTTKTGVTFSAGKPLTDKLVNALAGASRHNKGV